METLLDPEFRNPLDFETFKNSVRLHLKSMGDLPFLSDLVEKDEITACFRKGWYQECFYLVAMLDYLCRINNIELYRKYNALRCYKLDKPLWPADVLALCDDPGEEAAKAKAMEEAIPEFLRFNIVEGNVRDVE